jgi:hypothetical protein
MNAYVAVTDCDWFDFLSTRDGVDEVNFWQPKPWGGRFGVLRRGEPLLFKLKHPTNAIAGGGFFEYYGDLPLSPSMGRIWHEEWCGFEAGRVGSHRASTQRPARVV